MSGLNRTKKYRWQSLIWLFGVLYVVIAVMMMVVLYHIPNFYDYVNQTRIAQIKDDMSHAFAQTSSESTIQILTKLTVDKSMDIVVLSPTETFFATKKETDFSYLKEMVDTDMLSYQTSYSIQHNGSEYQVWMAIYKVTPQQFFIIVVGIIGLTVFVLCGIMAILVIVMFRKLLNPLRRLRINIMKLKEYRLAEVSAGKAYNEYDALSYELDAFKGDLNTKISGINKEYTILEKELEAQRELNVTKTRLVGALIHNMKTPLNIALLQSEQLKSNTSNQYDLIKDIEDNHKKLLNDINEILTVINDEHINEQLTKEQVDIVRLVRELLTMFVPLFKQREIEFGFVGPRELLLSINRLELKQILHNILSNASQYTDFGGEFELSIDSKEDSVQIHAYNDKKDISIIEFDRVFDLFYHLDDAHYGSGIGLYSVKSMVEACGGSCVFEPYKNGVLLSIVIPITGNRYEKTSH